MMFVVVTEDLRFEHQRDHKHHKYEHEHGCIYILIAKKNIIFSLLLYAENDYMYNEFGYITAYLLIMMASITVRNLP